MDKKQVAVSIIIPCLNVEDYIRECLESAFNQTLEGYEVLIIDAGSTDKTLEIINDVCKSREKEGLRVTLVNSDQKSYGFQVNLGIKMARGEYIAILESDDYISNDMYFQLYHKAKANNLDYIKGEFDELSYNSDGNINVGTSRSLWRCSELYDKVVVPKEIIDVFIYDYNVWRGIYNRRFLKENNISFSETPGASYQDIGFNMQVLCFAQRAMYLEEPFYKYRRFRADSSVNSNKGLEYIYYEFNNLIKNHSKVTQFKGFYMRLISSFWDEYQVFLCKNNNMPIKKEQSEIIQWFKEQIRGALELAIVNRKDFFFLDFEALVKFVNE